MVNFLKRFGLISIASSLLCLLSLPLLSTNIVSTSAESETLYTQWSDTNFGGNVGFENHYINATLTHSYNPINTLYTLDIGSEFVITYTFEYNSGYLSPSFATNIIDSTTLYEDNTLIDSNGDILLLRSSTLYYSRDKVEFHFLRLNDNDLFIYTCCSDLMSLNFGMHLYFNTYDYNVVPFDTTLYTNSSRLDSHFQQYLGGSVFTLNYNSQLSDSESHYYNFQYNNTGLRRINTCTLIDSIGWSDLACYKNPDYNMYHTCLPYNFMTIQTGKKDLIQTGVDNRVYYYLQNFWNSDFGIVDTVERFSIGVDNFVLGTDLTTYINSIGTGGGIGGGTTDTSWLGLFSSIADTPILILRSFFDFDLFGMNLLVVVLSLITGVIVFTLVRKFL